MTKIEGGCLCGGVRYRSEAEPVLQAACHCRFCQRATGSGFSLNVGVPRDSLEITGDSLRTYTTGDTTGSGRPLNRHFCGTCGSPIHADGEAFGPLAFIKAGTLDDTSWVSPAIHVWTGSKMPCVAIPEGVARAEGNPRR